MPIYVDEMTTDVTVVAEDVPLSPAQIDALVALVIRRLEQHERDRRRSREATRIAVAPSSGARGGG